MAAVFGGSEATLLISGISAALKAIDTWIKYRDSRRAAQEFDARFRSTQTDPAVANQAQVIQSIVPGPVLDRLTERTQECWTRYKKVLDGGFLPGEIDEATNSVKQCICRELRRMADLNNGNIPAGDLKTWWDTYNCASL